MIEEDYVSFETAKLLKEKGFDGDITTYRDDFIQRGNVIIPLQECLSKDRIKTSTLQMAMKWLREVHNIHCQIAPSIENGFHTGKYHAYIHKLTDNFPKDPLWFVSTEKSYEEACEAAIKYCLENLI